MGWENELKGEAYGQGTEQKKKEKSKVMIGCEVKQLFGGNINQQDNIT